MKLKLDVIAAVSLVESASIYNDVKNNINHAGYELLLAFLNYPYFNIYYKHMESILENQIKVFEILKELSQMAEYTAEKIIKDTEHQKAFSESALLTKHNLIFDEVESKNLKEPDLLTLLKQL